MRIKLAILEQDQSYLNRIVTVFNTKYCDKFEIYSFTDQDIAMSTLEKARIDVLVASDSLNIDVSSIPKRCGFAYFVDSADVDTVNEQRAICKFQKVDLIYKQILSIYSENASSISGLKLDDDSCKLIAFTSPSGGVGTSTMAAACALHYAEKGKKTLYLNLEKFGSSDIFFSGEGQFDMSDIIFALKSKKANISMKLESCVKQNERGVYFYSPSKVALDMLELTVEDIVKLISEIKLSGSYDYIILDMDFEMTKEVRQILTRSFAIVWVGDGSQISNSKILRAYASLAIREENEDSPLTSRTFLIYNKFSNKTSKSVELDELKNIGGAPTYKEATPEQLIVVLSKLDVFDKID